MNDALGKDMLSYIFKLTIMFEYKKSYSGALLRIEEFSFDIYNFGQLNPMALHLITLSLVCKRWLQGMKLPHALKSTCL